MGASRPNNVSTLQPMSKSQNPGPEDRSADKGSGIGLELFGGILGPGSTFSGRAAACVTLLHRVMEDHGQHARAGRTGNIDMLPASCKSL